ncbi:MAG: SpoIID/LytB domain-containing protein [Oscillospiraceae bacterium]
MKPSLKKIITALLAVVLLATAPCVPAFGAQTYYVNDGDNTLALADAYAIGADGSTAKLPERGVYAATAIGTQLLGGSEYDDEQPNIPNNIVRVGLAFGSTALEAVHLQIQTGSGFAFGYYDTDRVFQTVGSTAERAVTVIADTNVTVGDSTFGGYHVQLSDIYASFEAAQAAADERGGYPVFYNGKYRVRVGSYTSMEAASNSAATAYGSAIAGGARSVLVVKAGTDQILFGFDCGSSYSLSLSPQNGSGSAVTQIAECKDRSGTRSCTYYGDFQFARLSTQDPQKLTLVNFVGLEPYVKGVTPYEMSSGWPLEALKAQAVCARTYVASHMNGSPANGFDVTATTTSQVYYGTLDASANSDRAVDETAGKFVRYEGKLCETFYFAADGGATEDSENVWVTPVPYLRGVVDPYEKDIDFYCKSWSTSISRAAVGNVEITYTPIGNAMTVTVGGKTYSKDGVRTFLTSVCGLRYNSRHFTVEYDAASDTYLVAGGGFGHNCGMSQWGAKAMAQEHGKTYEEIISFYYTGAYVA